LRPGQARILEVPASVVMTGPLGAPAGYIGRRLRPFPGFGRILDALGRCWLRPSWGDPAVLRRATRRCLADGHPVINVMFHSSELMPGAFANTRIQLPENSQALSIPAGALETARAVGNPGEARAAVLGEGRMRGRAETDGADVLVLSSFPPGVGGGEIQTASNCPHGAPRLARPRHRPRASRWPGHRG
jgi:hypothetical protein